MASSQHRLGQHDALVFFGGQHRAGAAKGFYGKQAFFERSAKIPLILAGDGIPGSASVMDLGPTLCGLNGTPPFPRAGENPFAPALRGGTLAGRKAAAEFYELIGKEEG